MAGVIGKDLTGQVFGRLTVIGRGSSTQEGRLWLCRCDCGRRYEARGGKLTRGDIRSCGCARRGGLAAVEKQRGTLQVRREDTKVGPPRPCTRCTRWVPCAGGEMGGQCTAGLFLAGKPWSGKCPGQEVRRG